MSILIGLLGRLYRIVDNLEGTLRKDEMWERIVRTEVYSSCKISLQLKPNNACTYALTDPTNVHC